VIHEDYTYKESGWRLAQPFEAEWLRIGLSGEITIKANQQGYAWDGCTPKRSLLNLAIIGVPDGHVDYRTGLPYTYHASLVHDALYQYLDTIPVTKSQVDQLFLVCWQVISLRSIVCCSLTVPCRMVVGASVLPVRQFLSLGTRFLIALLD